MELITARATAQEVEASLAVDDVISAPAENHVVARRPVEDIIRGSTDAGRCLRHTGIVCRLRRGQSNKGCGQGQGQGQGERAVSRAFITELIARL